jgi:uncharacterized membrane protein HdeD (DUF308 family)
MKTTSDQAKGKRRDQMETTRDREIISLALHWKRLLWIGVALIVVGTIALFTSVATTLFSVLLLGGFLIAGAVVRLVECFHEQGWRGRFSNLLLAVLYGVGGVYLLVRPGLSALSLTMLIGGFLVFGGLLRAIVAIATRFESWGWSLVGGALTALLGFLILRHWPSSGLWVIGTFVAVDLIMHGWTAIMLSLGIRDAHRLVDTARTTEEFRTRRSA